MNIQGEHWLSAPPQVVWDSLHDEKTLRATIPGCQEFTKTAPNVFTGAASVGVGVIKGLYRGLVGAAGGRALHGRQGPHRTGYRH